MRMLAIAAAIDALAKDGVVFERAYSQIPLTLPSHATILSGQLPGKHGVRDNLGYRFDGSKRPYLPRLLGAAGWTTGAMVSSYVLRAETGLSEGFNEYESGIDLRTSEALGRSQRPGSETVELALDWLAKAKNSGDGGSQKPPFLLIHIYEPHTPYEPIEPFRSRYRDLYDGEVATADSIFGRFVAGLRDLDLYDDTTLVLLSDHGEGLGDHGEEEHGIFLYREAIQVPLVVKLANGRKKGTRIQTPTALADVAPTVLELAGLAVPPDVDGVALPFEEPKEAPRRAIYSETFYPRLHLGWNELTSAIRDRFHLIQGPDPELFDLVADPHEQQAFGVERGARAKLFDESLAVLRGAWAQGTLTHHGDRFDYDDLRVLPKPLQAHLDVWLGGIAASELRRVARLADGWLPSFVTPDDAGRGREVIEAALVEHGRTIDADHFGALLPYSWAPLPPSVVDVLAKRRPDLADPTVLVAQGWDALMATIDKFVAIGTTKFVILPIVEPTSPEQWVEHLEAAAPIVLARQT